MATKSRFQFELDTTPITDANGVIKGTLNAIESRYYINAFINYGLDVLTKEFSKDFDIVARGNPNKYHHVFEWETLKTGMPIPLYRLRKQGQGRARELSFYFVQSRRYVPLPPAQGQFDPSKIRKRHVFRWKAMVMEMGSPVHIVAKDAQRLIIPNDTKKGYTMAQSSTVRNPGGQATTGAFTGFWTLWFSGPAEQIVSKKIGPKAERAIKQEVEKGLRTVRSSSGTGSRTYSINAASGQRAMKEQEKRMEESAERYFDATENE